MNVFLIKSNGTMGEGDDARDIKEGMLKFTIEADQITDCTGAESSVMMVRFRIFWWRYHNVVNVVMWSCYIHYIQYRLSGYSGFSRNPEVLDSFHRGVPCIIMHYKQISFVIVNGSCNVMFQIRFKHLYFMSRIYIKVYVTLYYGIYFQVLSWDYSELYGY